MFSFVYKDIDFAHKLDHASSPNDEYDKHLHVFVELLYFVSGSVIYHVEGQEKNQRRNDADHHEETIGINEPDLRMQISIGFLLLAGGGDLLNGIVVKIDAY
ncbi:MAG: hypothetical protein J6038_05520 [Bacilli bacterium]|nr:hypothetical protein [Bacilli bacterium]